jgi:hypothetical protein
VKYIVFSLNKLERLGDTLMLTHLHSNYWLECKYFFINTNTPLYVSVGVCERIRALIVWLLLKNRKGYIFIRKTWQLIFLNRTCRIPPYD